MKIIVFIVIFFTSMLGANPLFPVKSHLCMGVFGAISSNVKGIVSNGSAYSVNSISDLRRNLLGIKSPVPNNSEGLFLSSSAPSKDEFSKVGGRLNAIEEFYKNKTDTDTGERAYTSAVSIVGNQNIRNFLKNYREIVESQGEYSKKESFNIYRNSALLNLFFLGSMNWDALSFDNPISVVAWPLFVGFQLFFRQDFIVSRPLYWNYSFLRQLDKLENSLDESSYDSLAVLSKNFKLDKLSIKNLKDPILIRDQFLQTSFWQTSVEALPIGAVLPARLKGIVSQPQWVGVDFVLENRIDREPELHLILRASEDMPIYPKGNKVKKEDYGITFEPALSPIPIRVKK